VYFVVEASVPVTSIDGWQTGRYEGTDANTLATEGRAPVVVRTALSFVSVEGARRNLEAKARPFGWDFDAVVASARQAWDGVFGRVEVWTEAGRTCASGRAVDARAAVDPRGPRVGRRVVELLPRGGGRRRLHARGPGGRRGAPIMGAPRPRRPRGGGRLVLRMGPAPNETLWAGGR